jgi:RNA polymerase sigma-70 factor (ECF subfamily)
MPILQLVEPETGPPERALLARLSGGDKRAFDEIVFAYLETLLNYAFHLIGTKEAAEDIAQEVFCWLWDNRLSLHVHSSLRAYLLTAVRHRALDHLRRTKREARGQSAYALEAEIHRSERRAFSADNEVTTNDLSKLLSEAIDKLPERRREILRLRWQQLTYAEIASTLGISVKTVEAQVTRAFETLRENLGPVVR